MILPKHIKTRHKIRDSQILELYLKGDTQDSIAKQFKISQERVGQIVRANASIALAQKDWHKIQRVNLLARELTRPEFHSQKFQKRDLIDLWRKEFEGDSDSVIDKKTIINVYVPGRENIDNRVKDLLPQNES